MKTRKKERDAIIRNHTQERNKHMKSKKQCANKKASHARKKINIQVVCENQNVTSQEWLR